MKSLLTAAALLAGVVTSGCDATCTIISETPDPGSNDLSAQSIAITFTLDKKEVTSMEVVHLLHDGQEIARSSQYSMNLSSNENSQSMVIRWSGKHKKNPSLTMTGTLRFGENKSIHYTEALYNQAKPAMRPLSHLSTGLKAQKWWTLVPHTHQTSSSRSPEA